MNRTDISLIALRRILHASEQYGRELAQAAQLNSLGSMRFYREAAQALGFETLAQEDMTHQLRTHYARVREELLANYGTLRDRGSSAEYLDRMAIGLENWVKAADAGHLAWGIQLFRKPA